MEALKKYNFQIDIDPKTKRKIIKVQPKHEQKALTSRKGFYVRPDS